MPEIPLQPVRRGVRAGHHSRRSGGIPGLEAAHSVADTDSCTRSSGGSKDTRVLAFLGVMFEPSSVARVQTKVRAFIGSKQKFPVLEKELGRVWLQP